MGRAQPHRIAAHHGGPPAKSGTASPHGPKKKAWLGSFAELWRTYDFGGDLLGLTQVFVPCSACPMTFPSLLNETI